MIMEFFMGLFLLCVNFDDKSNINYESYFIFFNVTEIESNFTKSYFCKLIFSPQLINLLRFEKNFDLMMNKSHDNSR